MNVTSQMGLNLSESITATLNITKDVTFNITTHLDVDGRRVVEGTINFPLVLTDSTSTFVGFGTSVEFSALFEADLNTQGFVIDEAITLAVELALISAIKPKKHTVLFKGEQEDEQTFLGDKQSVDMLGKKPKVDMLGRIQDPGLSTGGTLTKKMKGAIILRVDPKGNDK
jgi:hypothetical protein